MLSHSNLNAENNETEIEQNIEILKLIEKSKDSEQTITVEKEIKSVFISHHIRMIFQLNYIYF